MLAPSFETLDGLETLTECLHDHSDKLRVVWNELDPVVLNVRSDFAVLLNKLVSFIFIFFNFFFFFLFPFDNLFYL